MPEVLEEVAAKPPVETRKQTLETQPTLASKEIEIDFRGEKWRIKVELGGDPTESQWLAISDTTNPGASGRTIEIRVSLAHPFMVSFAQTDADDVEALLRVASAFALAETLARRAGVKLAGTVRRNLNDILREALSQPAT